MRAWRGLTVRPPAGDADGKRASARDVDVSRRSRSVLRASVRTAVALLSLAALLVTGFAWVHYKDFVRGLNRSALTAEAGPDGAVDILLVGLDSRTDAKGNPLPAEVLDRLRAGKNEAHLTDTLILVHIPQDGSRAVAFSLPRDTYVSMPHGHGQHKINSAFGRGKHRAARELRAQGVTDPAEIERRSSRAGRKLLLQTVEELSGVAIDHYAEANLLGFHEITKVVGGVPVCLKEEVEDPYSGADFKAGLQKISGTDALAFVRQRHGLPRGDLDRVVRQQAFLAGLARSMLSSGVLTSPSKLSGLIRSVQASLVLDDGWDVMTFAQRLEGLAGGRIRFETVPIEDASYQTSDGVAVKVDPAEVQRQIHSVRNGRPAPAFGRLLAAEPTATGEEATGQEQTGEDDSDEQYSTEEQQTEQYSNQQEYSPAQSPTPQPSTQEQYPTQEYSTEDYPTLQYSTEQSSPDYSSQASSTRNSPTRGEVERYSAERTTSSVETTSEESSDPPVPEPPREPITAGGLVCVN